MEQETLKIYLVRHGQTYSNIKDLLVGGGGNARLTEEGRSAAKAVGLGLGEQGISFDAAYSSTLGRAYETAGQIMGDTDLEITQVEELKDIGWGAAEGHTFEWLGENYPDGDYESFFSENSPIGAEDAGKFIARFGAALDKIAEDKEKEGGNVLVVAHSSMGFYLSAMFPDAGDSLDNTSVSIIEYKDGEKKLISFNDTSYLEAGQKLLDEQKSVTLTIAVNPLTQFEDAQLLEGNSDSDYTEAGAKVSEDIAAVLKKENFEAVYQSGLGRSGNLAKLFTEAPQVCDSFAEFFFGSYETLGLDELNKQDKETGAAVTAVKNILDIVTTDGESGEVAAYRMKTGLMQVGEATEPGKNVLICSHPYIVTAFMERYLPNADYAGTVKEAQVVKLEYSNGVFTFVSADNYSTKSD